MVKSYKQHTETSAATAFHFSVSEVLKACPADKSYLLAGVEISIADNGEVVVHCPTLSWAEKLKDSLEWAIRKHYPTCTVTYEAKTLGPMPLCSHDKAVRLMHLNPHIEINEGVCDCPHCENTRFWNKVRTRAGIGLKETITKATSAAFDAVYLELINERPRPEKQQFITSRAGPRRAMSLGEILKSKGAQ